MKKLSAGWIIHLFAMLHVAVVLGCRLGGIEDELLLTIITMMMTLIICIKKEMNIEFTAAGIIIVNIIGYLLGNTGANVFSTFLSSQIAVHALATAFTTEILGWSIIAFAKIPHKESSSKPITSEYLKWIILAALMVFGIRLGMTLLIGSEIFEGEEIMDSVSKILGSTFAIITLICTNIIFIRFSWRKKLGRYAKVATLITFTFVSAFLGVLLYGIGASFEHVFSSPNEFLRLYIAALIVQIAIYCIVYMVNYAISARNQMQKEKEKKHMAQFRYQRLKRQVNPHFLFNSLNALDCLVAEEKTEQASTYIHKLASVYRYMLKSEDEDFVQLSDELTFVEMYVDLLKVRFPEGFDVIIDVSEQDRARFVLPCSIQLLIENATKHNAVGSDNPLVIMVESDGQQVKVSNNIVPKVTRIQSTGLGHKYIRRQYLELSGKEIQIESTDKQYTVTLPLL